MSTAPTYREYVTDDSFQNQYSRYQQKYAVEPRESDKRLLQIISELLRNRTPGSERASLLDIGCSTGNFLRHARHAFPSLRLVGGDAAESVIHECQADESLRDIEFTVCDMLDLGSAPKYDIVVANAVTVLFDDADYLRCLKSVQRVLKPGGWYVSFDWIHPFPQELRITEISDSHPEGLLIHFRSIHNVRRVLSECGFHNAIAEPFEIPIDLNCSEDAEGFESIRTRTIRASDGTRMMFRGALYQPWSHLRAQKVV